MYLQTMNCYWRLTYRHFTRINNAIIRPYSHIPNVEKNDKSPNIMESKVFPDHQILYMFPNIIYPRILNRIKHKQTILAGASIPIILGLQVMGLISESDSIQLIFCSGIITVLFHAFCYPCNNFVGSIYFKKDDQEVIISYLNYWGERVDLKTDVTTIIPLTYAPPNVGNILYRILKVKSPKQNLKISIKYGQVVEETDFSKIFGDI